MKKSLVPLLAALALSPALAEFPERPITFVVPYAAGGPADLIGRAVAREMSELAGQPIVVENRAGAGGNIAGDYVARANKDGYTLIFEPVTSGSAENDSFYKWTPWGKLEMGTVNAEAAKQFEPGKTYYLDFTPAE